MTMDLLNIFAYFDYRDFLRDFYHQAKNLDTKVSHRYIAQRVGFSSSSFFTQIIRKQSNISDRLIQSFAKFLKLTSKETKYFEYLVHFNQAKTARTKRYYYQLLLNMQESSASCIQVDQYAYLANWKTVAIRQILGTIEFKGDFSDLARRVHPPISTKEAEDAVSLLHRLGLVEINRKGIYKWVSKSLSTKGPVYEAGIHSYLMETMELARLAFDGVPKKERQFSGTALTVSEKGFETIMERLRSFRAELLELAEEDENVDRVYHLNFQFFPISQVPEGVSK